MYEKLTPEQRNGLTFGSRIRCIGAIRGLLGNYRHQDDINPFTQDEIDSIERICENAKSRAKTAFEEAKTKLADAEASRRPEAEPRQYTGK